ncbi:hypothetical protein HOK51_04105 [Candidatus Woesearchaeota archaeon]|jgi:hypothetical protein|nr:hypothetical protein [Candidatus Woesearchaeota archaeon]MBT6519005.1 hypothetical protein [Candidatus Woesearchaeota archaeon]MBT7368796.1 hypothetical protein [Candidatus Woesearchaeota archaeon]
MKQYIATLTALAIAGTAGLGCGKREVSDHNLSEETAICRFGDKDLEKGLENPTLVSIEQIKSDREYNYVCKVLQVSAKIRSVGQDQDGYYFNVWLEDDNNTLDAKFGKNNWDAAEIDSRLKWAEEKGAKITVTGYFDKQDFITKKMKIANDEYKF